MVSRGLLLEKDTKICSPGWSHCDDPSATATGNNQDDSSDWRHGLGCPTHAGLDPVHGPDSDDIDILLSKRNGRRRNYFVTTLAAVTADSEPVIPQTFYPPMERTDGWTSAQDRDICDFLGKPQSVTIKEPSEMLLNSVFPTTQQASSSKDPGEVFAEYHVVKGHNRYGFIVDPGAASGIVGTDTVLAYQRAGVPFANDKVLSPSTGMFSGIDGEPVPGLGTLKQKAQIGRLKVRWQGDMIGHQGSFCPFLLPLSPLIEHRAIMMHGMFDNGDGAIILMSEHGNNEELHVARLLSTDSGHYLLPTDDPKGQTLDEEVLSRVCIDAFHSVIRGLTRLHSRSGDTQSPSTLIGSVNSDPPEDVLPGMQRPVADGKACVSTVTETSSASGNDPLKAIDSYLNKDQSESLLPGLPASGRLLPGLPASGQSSSVKPRHDKKLLSAGTPSGHNGRKNTQQSNAALADSEEPAYAYQTMNVQQMLKFWHGGKPYTGDVFPKHFSPDDQKVLRARYHDIPEEFYKKTKLPVVTPENHAAFMQAHQSLAITWALQEQFSGSGRVSWEAYRNGLPTLFPVDLRYGWDLNLLAHRKMIDLTRNAMHPLVKYSSPDCRHWTSMTNANPDREGLALARQQEFPMLDWLQHDNHRQAVTGYGYVNENGKLSQIWTQSPLSRNTDIPGNKSYYTDGCTFGLVNHDALPLRKTYRMDCNISLTKSVRRCAGHGMVKHGEIAGRTAATTTVYASRLAKALVIDIGAFTKRFVLLAGLVPVSH